MSNLCQKMGKSHIDLNKISIIPVGDADKMSYFATLLFKENLEFRLYLIVIVKDKKCLKN